MAQLVGRNHELVGDVLGNGRAHVPVPRVRGRLRRPDRCRCHQHDDHPQPRQAPKGRYSKHWTTVAKPSAWLGHAIESSTLGSTFTLRYVGGTLNLIGETTKAVGKLEVTLDGRSRTLHLHSSRQRVRQVLGTFRAKTRTHHLKLTVSAGTVALEGYGIASRTR